MLLKVSHIFEYLYLVMSALLIYKVATEWGQPDSQPIFFSILAAVMLFMFVFKRKFRKRMQERQNLDK